MSEEARQVRVNAYIKAIFNGNEALSEYAKKNNLINTLFEKNKIDVESLSQWSNLFRDSFTPTHHSKSLIDTHIRKKLREKWQKNNSDADDYYQEECSQILSLDQYLEFKNKLFMESWFATHAPDKQLPDDEQATAISSVNGHIQVVARAGSGKTSTLVNRTFFLQKHCGISPNEILILAFNRNAAKEISGRLKKLCGEKIPFAMTFHALANAIVHPTQEIIYNNSAEENQGLDRVFWEVIKDCLLEKSFLARVRKLMMSQFKDDWEEVTKAGFDFSPEKLYRFQKNLARETLRGEYVKSHGEKVIANFLFEHGIPYNYEKAHYWKKGAIYRPDFTLLPSSGLIKKGIIVEYFGLTGDQDYDDLTEGKKKYWGTRDEYELIDVYPSDFKGGERSFEVELKRKLQELGVICNRLSEEDIWQQIEVRAMKRFSSAMSGFIGRCRKAWILPKDLEKNVADHDPLSTIEGLFLELSVILYRGYVNRLEENNQQDFDGLMQEAVSIVEEGQTNFERKDGSGDLRKLRYILIDEYQDFSELFYRLILTIRQQNPAVEFFCVGDDWQAINGFAGSDLKFYDNFSSYFPQSKKMHISTNYRSVASVVTIGNQLMQGKGNPAIANSNRQGIVNLVNLSHFSPTHAEEEKFKNGALTPVILRLASKALNQNKSVALLSRRNELFIPSGGYMTIEKYLNKLRLLLPEEWRGRIITSTTHSFKGQEADVVIIMDALEGSYPLIHPSWIFSRILGENLDKIDDENRRLFYVALTRARDALFLITENGKKSPYLNDIEQKISIPLVDWSEYPPISGDTEALVVRISGDFYDLTDQLKADGYRFRRLFGKPVREKKYSRDRFSIKSLQHSPWAQQALSLGAFSLFISVLDGYDTVIASYSVNAGRWIKNR